MEFSDFKKQLATGKFLPAYILQGFSDAQLRKVLELMESAPAPDGAPVDRESYVAPEGVADALVSARSYPMWGERKLIALREIESLEVKAQERALIDLLAYLGETSSWATLLLVSGKSTPLAKGAKRLVQNAELVNAPRVQKGDLPGWVARKLAGADLELAPQAMQRLLEVCHDDWSALDRELEKVVVAFPAGTRIEASQLEFLVEATLEESVFDLLRLLAERRTGAVLDKLEQLQEHAPNRREQLMHLWYWLYRQTRELLATGEIESLELGSQAASEVGLNPKAQYILKRQLKGFSKSQLRGMLQQLEEIDRQLKSSYTLHSRLLLERYLIQHGLSGKDRTPAVN